MAKDRSNDLRRRPNLEQEDPTEWAHRKFGAEIADYYATKDEREAAHEADKNG